MNYFIKFLYSSLTNQPIPVQRLLFFCVGHSLKFFLRAFPLSCGSNLNTDCRVRLRQMVKWKSHREEKRAASNRKRSTKCRENGAEEHRVRRGTDGAAEKKGELLLCSRHDHQLSNVIKQAATQMESGQLKLSAQLLNRNTLLRCGRASPAARRGERRAQRR